MRQSDRAESSKSFSSSQYVMGEINEEALAAADIDSIDEEDDSAVFTEMKQEHIALYSHRLAITGLEPVSEVVEVCDDPHESSEDEESDYTSSEGEQINTNQQLLLNFERLISGVDSTIPAVINA